MSDRTVESYLEDQPNGGALQRRTQRGQGVERYGAVENPAIDRMWPPTLAVEIAMRHSPIKTICEDYDIDEEEWNALRVNPVFITELASAVEALRTEGGAFRVRAQMQSLALLEKSWDLIHGASTPHAVAADLIKHTIKVAGLDASKDQGLLGGKNGGAGGATFHLNIMVGGNR